MTDSPRRALLLSSALALFVELALIRYLGSEIRIFAYYKNLVLIACFLGFGVGFFRAAARPRLGTSLAIMALTCAVVSIGARTHLRLGPGAATEALSNFAGTLTMGEQNVLASSDAVIVVGFGWALALFLACLAVMFGFAQRIGADITAFPPAQRLAAYSYNVAGSLLGIGLFTLVSWLAIWPSFWFAPALLAAALLLPTRRARIAACVVAPLLAVVLLQPRGTVWSPYQRLYPHQEPSGTWLVMVNDSGYMRLDSFAQPGGHDRTRLPHVIRPSARNVLVIGAGGGNDVSAALHAGAQRVVAVEIDPEILALGRRLHPDHPYADPRVHVVIDDARHYGETSNEQFDLIVFSHLDSHTALSGFTNVRLDNYIYTVESFRTFRRLLAPEGALYVSFFSTRRWVADRLRENLRLAFDQQAPVTLYGLVENFVEDRDRDRLVSVPVINAHLLATPSATIRKVTEQIAAAEFPAPESAPVPPPSTDDWPYLFVLDRHVPTPMLILALMLAAVSGAFIVFHVRRERKNGSAYAIDRHYFFLGAGFLLVEVHNVGKLARVFGTTWSVNAWVIGAVLVVILAANAIIQRWPNIGHSRFVYPPLLVCLIAAANVPVEVLLRLPMAPLLVTLFYTSPLFFAGLIFASSFRAETHAMRALGSNLLGSLLGGFLELASFSIGLGALLYLAAALYVCSYPLTFAVAARRGTGASGATA